MNKKMFEKKLREAIFVLEDEVIQKEIDDCLCLINQKIDMGKSEEEAIKELGSISELQVKIMKKHGINPDKLKPKRLLYKEFEELFQVIHHVIDEMSKNSLKNNLKIIIDLIILIAFICLIKLPFILVRNLGDNLILYLEIPILSNVWGILIDIIYIIVAIMIFINIFNKYFKNIKGEKKTKIKSKELESTKLE